MTKKGALFDLDGVIIDSEGMYTCFWGEIGSRYGMEPTFAADIKGNTLKDILETYFSDISVRQQINSEIEKFEAEMRYKPFAGALEFIGSLRAKGFATAIVTSSDTQKMHQLFLQIPELENAVDIVVDGCMVNLPKPDPEGYLLAARKLGVDPSDCFVFEDSLRGLEAGRRAGGKVVGLATTLPRDVISGSIAQPDIVVEALSELTPERLLSL